MQASQALEYLRSSHAFCRAHALEATDPEAGETLRQLADEMGIAIAILEDHRLALKTPAEALSR